MIESLNPMDCILVLAEKLGISNLAQTYKGRLWEHKVDDRWTFAVNANLEPYSTASGISVDPFHVYVEFNGWPAAVFHASGEGTFVAGSAANAAEFNAALLRAANAEQIGATK